LLPSQVKYIDMTGHSIKLTTWLNKFPLFKTNALKDKLMFR